MKILKNSLLATAANSFYGLNQQMQIFCSVDLMDLSPVEAIKAKAMMMITSQLQLQRQSDSVDKW